MKKGLKITLIIIGIILLILINICVGAILINKNNTKKMLDDYSSIYTNDKYTDVVSVDNVNYIKQDVSCGYAVIEMFAKWRGNEEITEKYLYDTYGKVVTSTGKSFEEEMNKQFPEFKTTMYKNLNSTELIDKVYDSLSKGVPIPIEWAAKYEDKWTLHYSLVSGMDIPNDKVTIMNPYGYEENISIKEFIDRTSYEAYEHMPLLYKLGFAFNIFEKNTIFIVDMPIVLDSTPQVGDGTPQVGSREDIVDDSNIIGGDIWINISQSVKINGEDVSKKIFRFHELNNESINRKRVKGYKLIKTFQIDFDRGYLEALISFNMISNVSFDNVDLFYLRNGNFVKVDKYEGDSKVATYDIQHKGVYAFYMKE